MAIMSTTKDMCRLCLTSDDLVWIFDKRFESSDNMKEVIYITTGVEITSKDIISQKICKKCCQVTIKMFEFRRTSLKNDQYLKEQCKIFLKSKEIQIPITQVTITSEDRTDLSISINNEKKTEVNKNGLEIRQEAKSLYKIHPTVRELFKIYPQIKIPTVCLKYNIAPCVAMKMDQVENYFKSRKLNFQEYTKLALKTGKVATKRTSKLKSKCSSPKPASSSKISKSVSKDPVKIKATTSRSSKSNYKILNKCIDVIVPNHMTHSETGVSKSNINEDPSTSPTKVSLTIGKSSSSKRKYSEIERKELKKSNFVESLGLPAKINLATGVSFGGGLSYVANNFMPLHICEICNSVQYSAKDLRRHQNSHLCCQFCKTRFHSLEIKKKHLNNRCAIKNMMNNLPDIKLQRVELNEWVRSIYHEAIESLQSFNNDLVANSLVNISEVGPVDAKNVSVNVESKPRLDKQDQEKTATSNLTEIIEILSDDEDHSSSSSSAFKEPPLGPLVRPTLPIQTPPRVSVVNTAHLPLSDNIVYNTVSIVRPDIKIKGSRALDVIDARLTDIKVLKELLTIYRPVCADKNVQTEMPANNSIIINRLDMTTDLRMLKPQLHVYKVPVVMKNGHCFDVSYNYIPEQKPLKKMCLWNDLASIDIKQPQKMASLMVEENDKFQNRTILPSIATLNSSGSFSVSPQSTSPSTSKFIRVNASSLSPIAATSFKPPPTNLINTTPILKDYVRKVSSSAMPTTMSVTTTEQTASAETTVSSTARPQLGIIRVKNVWELT